MKYLRIKHGQKNAWLIAYTDYPRLENRTLFRKIWIIFRSKADMNCRPIGSMKQLTFCERFKKKGCLRSGSYAKASCSARQFTDTCCLVDPH